MQTDIQIEPRGASTSRAARDWLGTVVKAFTVGVVASMALAAAVLILAGATP